jgi:hypothetical protein
MLVVENESLLDFLREHYSIADLDSLLAFLGARGTFEFPRLQTGPFPAVASMDSQENSGYQYVWIRDNIHVAHAHYAWGDTEVACKVAETLLRYFESHRYRFQNVIEKPDLAHDPMNRPHIRFDGEKLCELNQRWPHAQNDAIGYFLWFYCKLARESKVDFGGSALERLVDIVLYLHAIAYWSDSDSGHWEEARKVSASSIGVVIAGLREFHFLALEKRLYSCGPLVDASLDEVAVQQIICRGQTVLDATLPAECTGTHGDQVRRYDAALLFLVYPLEVVSNEMAARILSDVQGHLEGERGIRRYLGDSYWCPDYKKLFPAEVRTADFSNDIALRDSHAREGAEAQWCLFDSIVSIVYASRADKKKDSEAFNERQIHYLNRALGQLTGGGRVLPSPRCPEAYYLDDGRYVANDHVPLLWAQANLKLALYFLRRGLIATHD